MNQEALKQAEKAFLRRYPGGFDDPALQDIGKRHQVGRRSEEAQVAFAPEQFEAEPAAVAEAMVRIVSRSSLVSLFEKPKFRDAVLAMGPGEQAELVAAFGDQLHGEQGRGFERLVEILAPYKLAKWSLVTILPNYYRPDAEVFVKPTTAKGVISHFGLEGLQYRPRPSWDFYRRYRAEILAMRKRVDPALAPNNAAFCGFLMMSL